MPALTPAYSPTPLFKNNSPLGTFSLERCLPTESADEECTPPACSEVFTATGRKPLAWLLSRYLSVPADQAGRELSRGWWKREVAPPPVFTRPEALQGPRQTVWNVQRSPGSPHPAP